MAKAWKEHSRGVKMLVTVSGDCGKDRKKIRELIEEYGRTEGKQIKVEEYPIGRKEGMKMVFSFVEGSTELELQNIIYIETDRHKNIFHTRDGDYGLYKKLDEIEADLESAGCFVRVHKSFLVNMQYIEKINSYILLLTTGRELSVPKSRYPYVKKTYASYRGE